MQGAGCKVQGARCAHESVQFGASLVSLLRSLADMAAHTFEELDAWRLSDELKKGVSAILANSRTQRAGNFRDQIRSAAASAPANISEGFGYYDHPQFARHVRIAIASLDETRNHLLDGIHNRYWSAERAEPLLRLAKRARGAAVGLLEHLATTEAPQPWQNRPLGPRRKRRR